MRRRALSLVLLCAFFRLSLSSRDVAVVGYLPEWRYEGANWDTILQTVSHLLLFSLEVGPGGAISAQDRLPRPELMAEARAAAALHGSYLMLCFGGNGRSDGFAPMATNKESRAAFVRNAASLVGQHGLHGVDINWEYAGYEMGRGYKREQDVTSEYAGLVALLEELRAALPPPRVLTLAYYPDGRQEELLAAVARSGVVDLLHAMSYDASGSGGDDVGHSPVSLARRTIERARSSLGSAASRVTVGLPFYARHSVTGDWKSYEDLVPALQRDGRVPAELDTISVEEEEERKKKGNKKGGKQKRKRGADGPGSAVWHFNGAGTIALKTRMALEAGLGGVMVWEVSRVGKLEFA